MKKHIGDSDAISPPRWLQEQPHILSLLHYFVTKLDDLPAKTRVHPPAIRINQHYTPWLFELGEQADQQWMLLRSLIDDYSVFLIKYDKKRNPLDPEYSNARLKFNLDAEERVRQWIQRPGGASQLRHWQSLVEVNARYFPGSIDRLKARNIKLAPHDSEEIVAAFIRIGDYAGLKLSLRQISSLCFWGDSKALDNREELVRSLYPEIHIEPRPILVNLYLPKHIGGVLFIENQECYTQAVAGLLGAAGDLALVYCAGFKGSAERIRDAEGVSLHYHHRTYAAAVSDFESWWFDVGQLQLPVFFWGDLDFTGMAILKTLKQRFLGLQAWEPGYRVMLHHLRGGNGHRIGEGEKQNQTDPVVTGCQYADEVLLPAIRIQQAFMDQEVVVDLS